MQVTSANGTVDQSDLVDPNSTPKVDTWEPANESEADEVKTVKFVFGVVCACLWTHGAGWWFVL